jgi:hypothetical protein
MAATKIGQWVKKWEVEGKSGTYVVSESTEGVMGCSCPQWKFRRQNCKHIQLVVDSGMKPTQVAKPDDDRFVLNDDLTVKQVRGKAQFRRVS